jgi:hypothetical protein
VSDQTIEPENAEELPPIIDETWPWPQFLPGAPRNYRRYYHERFTGWEGDFLRAYMDSGIVRHACEKARVTSSMVQRRRKEDAEFDSAFLDAFEGAADTVEATIMKRGRDGVPKIKEIYERDSETGQMRLIKREETKEVSDTLLIFMAKAMRPEKFRDTVDHSHKMVVMREEARRIAAQEGLDEDAVIAEAERLMGVKRK